MKETPSRKYKVNLEFEEVRLPPFEDILIVGKRSPHGRMGLSKSFQFLIPDEFEVFETGNLTIDSVFIKKRLLKKMEKEKILSVLESKVFPFVNDDEITKVSFKTKICYDTIKEE